MLSRMVRLARAVARYIRSSPHYELLPRLPPDNTSNDNHGEDGGESERQTFIIVLFRAADPGLNETLVDRINADGRMFVSGTVWEGRKAARMAVASWRVDVERDAAAIAQVLDEVSERWIREKKTM
jgi:glutamate/tyrosine decarboxylase-like PLP-dependent enzyme